MLPFKKILCPTDFSEPSYEAIKAAGELASHFASELCIVHVISPVPVIPAPAGQESPAFNVSLYEKELEAASKRTLDEVLGHLETKEVRAHLIAVRGNAADEIVRTAKEEQVDLIVIATRGRTGVDRMIFGSVAEKVVRLAPCPVLTILSRHEEEMKGKEVYQEKIEAQLKEWGARIDVLRAKAEKSKAEVKIKYLEQIEELKHKQETVKRTLHKLKESGGEAWDEFKSGVDKALEDLKDAFDRAISKFKER